MNVTNDSMKETLIEDGIIPKECMLEGMKAFELLDDCKNGNPCSICEENCKSKKVRGYDRQY